MGCNCGSKSATAKSRTYVVTAKDGTKKSFSNEIEAAAAARRLQGSYRPG